MIDMFQITEDDAKRRRAALATMLDQMEVPQMRKELTDTNLRWLMRNIGSRNSEHPMVQPARDLIKWLLRWGQKQNA